MNATSRQMRSARNALAEALGLGEAWPLRDLTVKLEPPVVPVGGTARLTIEDSERDVAYRLLDQAGEPLPGGAAPEATGTGAALLIETPPITEDATFTVRATRLSGRAVLLAETAPVRVGLDGALPVAAVGAGDPPLVLDYGARIRIEVGTSQEGVLYRLVARPAGAVEDPAADTALDAAGIEGTGAAIRLESLPLTADTVVRVRALKPFAGPRPRPAQTQLLDAAVPVSVRADPGLALRAVPAVVDHGAAVQIALAASQPGVDYAAHAIPILDEWFSRTEPPDPAALVVPTGGGDVGVLVPPEPVPAPAGEPVAGTGAGIVLTLPPRTIDALVRVEARKAHGAGAQAFVSTQWLATPAAVLVRPDPQPPLRLEAELSEGRLVRLTLRAGQAGVFYAFAGGAPLGELYLHQTDAADAARTKGVGRLALSVDFVVAGDVDAPALDLAPLALPVELSVAARRAMTGLTADLGRITIAALPAAEVRPTAVVAGGTATVEIARPVAWELYALLVNGQPIGAPVAGAAGRLRLQTGALAAGDRVELWAGREDTPIRLARRTALMVTVG
ncbi:MAG TPA: hypothetical protein VLA00_13800 [Xanthobacteraceae bacterium]|nr:hypothetical protein [Xanthobacteraceae bacterium]